MWVRAVCFILHARTHVRERWVKPAGSRLGGLMRRQRSLMILAAACAGVCVASAPALVNAAAVTWDGGGAGSVWSDDANWGPDGPVAGSDAKFAAAGASTTAGTVTNIVGVNTAVLSLGYNQFGVAGTANAHTTQINDGVMLTLNGSGGGANGATLYVGSGADSSSPAANNLTF